MLRNIFSKTLWDQRRGIVIWSLAIAAVGVMYAAFYPLMRNPEMEAVLDAYPPELLDALDRNGLIAPITARQTGFDAGAAYEVSAEILRRRRARGERPIGRNRRPGES